MVKSTNCGVCNTRIKKGQARKINSLYCDYFRKLNGSKIPSHGNICLSCRKLFNKKANTMVSQTNKPKSIVILPFRGLGRTKARCVVCKNKGKAIIKVPSEARLQTFIEQGVLVPVGARCCRKHLIGNNLKPGTMFAATNNTTKTELEEVVVLLEKLRKVAAKTNKIDFDNPVMNDEQYYNITGLYKHQFDDLCSKAISLKSSKHRTPRQAVGMLLMKLRLGVSDRVIGTLCGIDQRRRVSCSIISAKCSLVNNFVPSHLGFSHITRDEVLENHTTDISIQLMSNFISDSVILIMDGTYIYIQKSTKHRFQRKYFSMHKYRPLIKPMMIVTTDGYIVSVIGPYFANSNNNDAAITKHMFETNADNISSWMKEDDILILDRGFRDVLPFLADIGLQTHSPAFLGKGEKQLPSQAANSSRIVTKLRWAVESVNGRIKTWQYLNKVISNKDLPNIWSYISIVAALCNKYRPPLRLSLSTDCDVARQMMQKANGENSLKQRILSDKKLQRHASVWKGTPIDSKNAVVDFPVLSEDDLRSITFGIYQVKQARSYADEHVIDGTADVFVNTVIPGILHARLQSKHTSAKQHNVWIAYTHEEITEWYCECRAGSRTVGCCVHVATIMWYLSYARHIDHKSHPDKYSKLLLNATDRPNCEIESSSDDSS